MPNRFMGNDEYGSVTFVKLTIHNMTPVKSFFCIHSSIDTGIDKNYYVHYMPALTEK